MGRDWYWSSRGGAKPSSTSTDIYKRSASDQRHSGCITAVFHLFGFHHFHFPLNQQTTSGSSSSSSCSCFKPHSFLTLDSTNTTIKGAKVPRNSLDLLSEEHGSTSTSASASASLTSTTKEEEILNIPTGIQIKTSGNTRSKVEVPNSDTSSEISCSPATNTPTLVARLMGLDLLPESSSPSFSSAPNFQAKSRLSPHIQHQKSLRSKITSHRNSWDGDIRFRGTRSLPETPRTSSARRSDVDHHHHHRHSLQIKKENMSSSEELLMSRLSSLKRKDLKHEDENRSPAHYARQVAKHAKESRNVGMDITNIVRNKEQARDLELVSQFKYKKISISLTKVANDSSPRKRSTASCSTNLRFLESKSKPVINSSTKYHNPQPQKSSLSSSPEINNQPQPFRVSPKPKLQPVEEEQDEQHKRQQQQQRAASKCKKASNKKFVSRLTKPQQASDIIRNKQEVPFVRPSTANKAIIPDKKCRKTPLSNDLLNRTVPALLPVIKDLSPPATKIPQNQVLDARRPKRIKQISTCSTQTYIKQEAMHAHVSGDNNKGDRCKDATTTTSTSAGSDEAEYEYIARILRRTGIDKETQVSSSWFSPSHPLDPSIFYYLELFTACSTNILINDNDNETKCSRLSHGCNRKLLFDLVDEILTEILKRSFNMKSWVITIVGHDFSNMDGSQLIDTLCSKIRTFPRSDCRVLEDIDALIDRDLPESKLQSVMAYEEEGEGIVAEIEKNILEALVHETAMEFGVRV